MSLDKSLDTAPNWTQVQPAVSSNLMLELHKSTGQPSNQKIRTPNCQTLNTSFKALLPNKMLKPKAMQCDILPGLQHNWLASVGKLSDAGYCTIFMPGNQGVPVIGGNNVKIHVSGEAVLRGWRDPQGLWRVPLDDDNIMTLSPQRLCKWISQQQQYFWPTLHRANNYILACMCWFSNKKDMNQGN